MFSLYDMRRIRALRAAAAAHAKQPTPETQAALTAAEKAAKADKQVRRGHVMGRAWVAHFLRACTHAQLYGVAWVTVIILSFNH